LGHSAFLRPSSSHNLISLNNLIPHFSKTISTSTCTTSTSFSSTTSSSTSSLPFLNNNQNSSIDSIQNLLWSKRLALAAVQQQQQLEKLLNLNNNSLKPSLINLKQNSSPICQINNGGGRAAAEQHHVPALGCTAAIHSILPIKNNNGFYY
jgi:hypothetical protein